MTLVQLSANVVRRALRPNAICSVDKLPLPKSIKDIVVKKHISCSIEELHTKTNLFDDDYDDYWDGVLDNDDADYNNYCSDFDGREYYSDDNYYADYF